MLLQNVPNSLLLSYRSEFRPPGRDPSAARWACRCHGKPPRARRPNFVVRRAPASCKLTVGSGECRQAATGCSWKGGSVKAVSDFVTFAW